MTSPADPRAPRRRASTRPARPGTKRKAGESAAKVSAALPARETITETAALLRTLRRLLERFEKSFPLPEGNPVDPFLRELTYVSIVNRVLELDLDAARGILKDAREHQKAAAYSATSQRSGKRKTPQEEALEVRRRWRELYGLPPNPEATPGG